MTSAQELDIHSKNYVGKLTEDNRIDVSLQQEGYAQDALKPIDKFTIPGGNAVVSMCHVCRTVCRRAERAALRADEKYGTDATVLMWLNRLSDYFYLLGRTLTEHYGVEETLWIP